MSSRALSCLVLILAGGSCVALSGCAAEAGGVRLQTGRPTSLRAAPAVWAPRPIETHHETNEATEPTGDGDPFSSIVEVTSETARTVGHCLGVMVAPRVAITAGHCVSARTRIKVRAATSGGKSVEVESFWFDPDADSRSGNVDMNNSDVALLVLARALPMPSYARYAHGPLEGRVWATGIRHGGGRLESMAFTLRPAQGRERYYISAGFAKPGDSGSPGFVGRGESRIVVGVLAGGSPGREVFARVDLMARKLDELVMSTSTSTPAPKATTHPRPREAVPTKTPPKKPSPSRKVTWE